MSAAPVLTFYRDGEKISEKSIDGEILVGRADGCVIQLNDRAISRKHALFKRIDQGLQVERKSDFSPISVNGAECTSAVLKEGDVIGLGPYIGRVTFPQVKASKQGPIAEVAAFVTEQKKSSEEILPATEVMKPIESMQISLEPSNDQQPILQSTINEPPSLAMPSDMQMDVSGQPPLETPQQSSNQDEDKTLLGNPAKVIIVLNPNAATPVEFEMDSSEAVIGRSKECQIQINDKKSSRRHAKISRRGLSFFLKDLDTVNGTFVNGQKVTETELTGEDLIQIGDTELRFKVFNPNFSSEMNAQSAVGDVTGSEEGSPADGASLESPPPLDLATAFPPENQMASAQNAAAEQQAYMAQSAGAIPAAAMMPQAFGMSPGVQGIPAQTLPGMPSGKKASLLEKFRAMPKPRQILIGLLVLCLAGFLIFYDGEEGATKPQAKVAAGKTKGTKGSDKDAKDPKTATYESLTAEQKSFVDTQYTLGLDYYKNKDYDKSLFEIRKIFQIIPDYKDARQVERYAQEAKRIIDAREEEKRKDEESKRVKARVAQLVEQGQSLMNDKKYDKVQDVFSDILELDPENTSVAKWKAQIQEFYAQKQIQEENEKRIKDENKAAWSVYLSGQKLLKQSKYYSAISTFQKAIDFSSGNKKVFNASKKGIAEARAGIHALIDPVLEEAKQAESSGDAMNAYKFYHKASKIDPRNDASYAGMDRVRGALQQKAKEIYAEAVIAESYSDFPAAEKHYREVLEMVPEDDLYYDRAKSRLKRYSPYAKIKETE